MPGIRSVQVVGQLLQLLMEGVIKYIPVQYAAGVPFRSLAKPGSHEQQFFAGMGKHMLSV